MDLTESIEPRSDQLNADSFIGGPATYTIREVIDGVAESPFDFKLVETERCYRPSKTMRRVIVGAWGPEAANYSGRRLTLYREPSIKFGGQTVGGIRISHMSHISGPVEVMAQTTRGKRETFTVQPIEANSAHLASSAPGDPPVEPNPDHLLREGEPAFGASTDPTEGGDAAKHGAQQPESAAPQESLRSAINKQVRSLQMNDRGGELAAWCAAQGVAQTSGALADHFGEAARDLRGLMGSGVAP